MRDMLYSSAYSDTVDGCELHFAPLRNPMVPLKIPTNTGFSRFLGRGWVGLQIGRSPSWVWLLIFVPSTQLREVKAGVPSVSKGAMDGDGDASTKSGGPRAEVLFSLRRGDRDFLGLNGELPSPGGAGWDHFPYGKPW